MIEIKKYEEKYKEDVRNICLDTAGSDAREEKVSRFLLATYCDYYLEHESEHCFVAVENSHAVGYVICAADYERYRKFFKSEYYPRVRNCGFAHRIAAWGAMTAPMLFKRKFPAHLHIDIKPGLQGCGTGTRLMEALLEHLSAEGVPGVMLIVGHENAGARRFYAARGFSNIFVSKSFGVVMGKRLAKEN